MAEAAPPFLPYGRQTIEDDDVAAVAAALRSDFLTTGPLVERFEAALAQAVGAAEAVVCNSGTAALHLSLKASALQAGETCIVPAVTFAATANAVRYEGGEVVFADVDPLTGLMTPDTLAEALDRAGGRRLRAVLPVHLGGHTVDLPAIRALAETVGAQVIEDACHGLGGADSNGPVGGCAQSLMACFSFHPVKTICTGEGGAVTTQDPALAARMRTLRSHGITREPADFVGGAEAFDHGVANPWWYEQQELGWNDRLPDVLCALGLSQIAKLDRFVARRRALTALYDQALAPLAPVVRRVQGRSGTAPALHLLQVLIDFEAVGLSRRAVMEALRAQGIGTQVHYIPVPWQPYYRARYGSPDLPGAKSFYRACLSLPLYPGMADGDPERVAAALGAALGRSPAIMPQAVGG
jgi:UDP-4-amino-4,6-dideoxy-N-acetyl-beta-L-altrosamine transaminase